MDTIQVKQLNVSGGTNRFKFQSFNDRIKNIKINSIHRVIKVSDASEDVESFFQDTLTQMSDLNCTTHFTLFQHDISKYTGSLMQILYHKECIVQAFEKHLAVPKSQAIQPILSLVTALAKDLQEEFYPHFPVVFQSIVLLVKSSTHPEVLEAVFNNIAFLFKYLSKELLVDLEATYSLFIPVLEHPKLYVRSFAAESFGFLLRKIKEEDKRIKVFTFIMETLLTNNLNEYLESVSLVYFETVKQVQGSFCSKSPQIFQNIVTIALDQNEKHGNSAGLRMCKKLMALMGHYGSKESMSDLWKIMINTVDTFSNASTSEQVSRLNQSLVLISQWIGLRRGSRINEYSVIFELFNKLATPVLLGKHSTSKIQATFVQSFCLLLINAPLEDALVRGRNTVVLICTSSNSDLAFYLFETLLRAEYVHFAKFIFPFALGFVQHYWNTSPERCILLLSSILGDDFEKISNQIPHALKDKTKLIRFSETDVFARRSDDKSSASFTINIGLKTLDYIKMRANFNQKSDELDVSRIAFLYAAISVLTHLSVPEDALFDTYKILLVSILQKLKSLPEITINTALVMGDGKEMLKSLAGSVLSSMHIRSKKTEISMAQIWDLVMVEYLEYAQTNISLLNGVADYVESISLSSDSKQLLSVDTLPSIVKCLQENVGSVYSPVRLCSLRILCAFEQVPLKPVKDVSLCGPCQIFQICLDLEQMSNTVANARDKVILLRKLDILASSKALPTLYETITVRYLCAMFSVNFNVIWPEATKGLVAVAKSYSTQFWPIFYSFIELAKDMTSDDFGHQSYSIETNQMDAQGVNELSLDATIENADLDEGVEIDDDNSEESDGDAMEIENSTKLESKSKYRKNFGSKKSGKTQGFKKIQFSCSNQRAFETTWKNAVGKFDTEQLSSMELFVSATQPALERVDSVNIYCLLIRALASLPDVVNRYSKDIVPLFLKMFRDEYDDTAPSTETKVTELDKKAIDETEKPANTSTLHARTKILAFLEMFSKIRNSKGLAFSTELFAIFNQLLTKGDAKVQKHALDCVLTWNQPGVAAYSGCLYGLINDESFRDSLSTIDMEDLYSKINTVDQPALMHTISRILYGKLISHRQRQASKTGLKARRIAVFSFVAGLQTQERQYIIDLMLKPFSKILLQADPESGGSLVIIDNVKSSMVGPLKKQIGFMTVLEDLFKQLRSLIAPHLFGILKTIIYLIHHSETVIREAANQDKECVSVTPDFELGQLREVRVLAVQRLIQLFSTEVDFDFSPYIKPLFVSHISHRLSRFHIENTQAPSALLELIASWSKNVKYIGYLTEYDSTLLPSVFSLLSAKKVHASVVSVVVGMIESIQKLHLSYPDLEIMQTMLIPHMTIILGHLEYVLENTISSGTNGRPVRFSGDNITMRIIRVISALSNHVTVAGNAETLVTMLLPFLKRPDRVVPEITKVDILEIFGQFIPILPTLATVSVDTSVYYPVVCQLFSTLKTRLARTKLLFVFRQLVSFNPSDLSIVADLLDDMNAFSPKRMDEPDFNRRFGAFSKINEELYTTLEPIQWRPILYNLVFYTQEEEEFSIRTSASYGIQRFITQAGIQPCNDVTPFAAATGVRSDLSYMDLVLHLVLPSIKIGIKHKSITIRQEFCTLLGQLVETFPSMPQFEDMTVLLAKGNDEVNFFNNIYHLQVHRRQRALRRLADACNAHQLKSNNIANIFLPLVSHFIFESDRIQEHNVINDSIVTLGACAGTLKWTHYYSLVKRFLNLIGKQPRLEKIMVRSLVHILDQFHFDLIGDKGEDVAAMDVDEKDATDADNDEDNIIEDDEDVDVETKTETAADDKDSDMDGKNQIKTVDSDTIQKSIDPVESILSDPQTANAEDCTSNKQGLTAYQLQSAKILDATITKILPHLQRILSIKDDESIPIRIPLAIAITKVFKQFPLESMHMYLPKLLLTMCNILSSHIQSARDATRETLVKVAVMLGPMYLSFIIKELRTALRRGYQLHVLGYTLFSLMTAIVPITEAGAIDSCIKSIVDISINDIFGDTGKERDVEELRGKMREIRTTKSFDTLELTLRVLSLSKINLVIVPIKELMAETGNIKVIRQIKEIFRRLALGINTNSGISTVEFMKFVHGLITENLALVQYETIKPRAISNAERNFSIQLKRNDPTEPLKYLQANAHLFVEFGLELLHTALKRERIDLREKEHLQMMDPLVDVLEKSLCSKHVTINVITLRILCNVIRSPLPSLKKFYPVFVERVFQIISESTTTSSELVQKCFRFLTIILRDCSEVSVSENQIITLATLIQPDLEEPDRQATTFSLIRAILGRKYVFKEIYDLMDIVIKLLVTSQSSQVRELSRQAYMQFLLDYPHGHVRFRKQITYMIKNLEYDHETGRESILEVLSIGIAKFSDEIIKDYAEMLFLALVMSLVNDSSSRCRKLSALRVGELLKRLDVTKSEKSITLVFKWFTEHQQPALRRTAAQVFGIVIQTFGSRSEKWVPNVLESIDSALVSVIQELENRMNDAAIHLTMTSCMDEENTELALWELGYYSLNTLLQIVSVFPSVLNNTLHASDSHAMRIWKSVSQLLLHPHQWIRSMSAKLIGLLFSHIDPDTRSVGGVERSAMHVLIAQDSDIKQLAGRCCGQLDSDLVSDELAKQTVKNLVFLGRCLALSINKACQTTHVNADVSNTVDSKSTHDKDSGDGITGTQDNEALDDIELVQVENEKGNVLMWLTRRLSYLARLDASKRRGPILRRSVFQWFAAISMHIPKEVSHPYYMCMISTLYRSAKNDTAKGPAAEEIHQLALEVMNMFQKQLGTTAYIDMYNTVHLSVEKVRRDRRTQKSIQAVVDPEASSRRRIQKNVMKQASRKRKSEEHSKQRIRTKISRKA
ncbi:U3 snoRNP protein [Batrachochytrium dendrobatidis]|nr:U3 snoRNP protein [Batrachochytrium dendrobatidis]